MNWSWKMKNVLKKGWEGFGYVTEMFLKAFKIEI